MTEQLEPLDPDLAYCTRCKAEPGDVCRTPRGEQAASIHAERRRRAAAGLDRVDRPRTGVTPPPADARSKGGKATAQARRRRKAELAAETEQRRADLERAALEREADALAADAARYANDRAKLRRKVLDGASIAYDRLIESLEGLERVKVDDEGKPYTRAEEYEDRDGRTRQREVPDVRGAYSAATAERIAKVAASALVSLRLEEGKPTGITELATGQASEVLGAAGVDELLAWAGANLPGEAMP